LAFEKGQMNQISEVEKTSEIFYPALVSCLAFSRKIKPGILDAGLVVIVITDTLF
jgi:hypothetical protein